MHVPAPADMIEQIRALPSAAPLLAALGDRPGAYLVGGAVRDLLLGRRALDLDVVVEGDALVLAREIGGEIRSYDRFGTCTVRLDGGLYDLASARRERYPRPGALPEVQPAGIEEDLRRRDFSVNALAVALTGAAAGSLLQAPGGVHDLAAGQMRILHPVSFRDDPTRLLRLVRYASRLGFSVEPDTDQLAHEAVGSGALDTVSGPRIGTELRLAALEPDPVLAVAALAHHDLDHAIHPGLRLRDPGGAKAALALLPEDGRPDRLVLAAAAQGIDRGELAALLDRLGFAAPDRQAMVAAATRAHDLARALEAARTPSEVAAAVDRAPEETVALAGALGPREAARQWLSRLRHIRLEITGADLLRPGSHRVPRSGAGWPPRWRPSSTAGPPIVPASLPSRWPRRLPEDDHRACDTRTAADGHPRALLPAARAPGHRPARRSSGVHDPARRALGRTLCEPEPRVAHR